MTTRRLTVGHVRQFLSADVEDFGTGSISSLIFFLYAESRMNQRVLIKVDWLSFLVEVIGIARINAKLVR